MTINESRARVTEFLDVWATRRGNHPEEIHCLDNDKELRASDLRAILGKAEIDQSAFQSRVQPWMMECFGAEISADREERNHRFYEEATEAIQANGMTRSEAHQLVDYTFDRPVGELHQEIGGVMVTLAALCLASGVDMHKAAEIELARVWTKVEQIRAKQAAKPKHSALPVAPPKFLFVAMDDDKRAHLTYCSDDSAVWTAVRDSMFMQGDLDPDHLEQVNGVLATLLDEGCMTFEGDAPLYLYRLPEQIGDESHHSNLNGGSL